MTSRSWLITGVSSGFGHELTTQLLGRGDIVVGTARRPDSVAASSRNTQTRSAASCWM
jgi:short-subunit dehydrogenase